MPAQGAETTDLDRDRRAAGHFRASRAKVEEEARVIGPADAQPLCGSRRFWFNGDLAMRGCAPSAPERSGQCNLPTGCGSGGAGHCEGGTEGGKMTEPEERIVFVDIHDFLGVAPDEERLAAHVPGLTRAGTITEFLGEDFLCLQDLSGVVRAGLRNDGQGSLVIFAYSREPQTLPVRVVGNERQLPLRGNGVKIILAVDGQQKRLLVSEPLKSTAVALGIATDQALFHFGTAEVLQHPES